MSSWTGLDECVDSQGFFVFFFSVDHWKLVFVGIWSTDVPTSLLHVLFCVQTSVQMKGPVDSIFNVFRVCAS